MLNSYKSKLFLGEFHRLAGYRKKPVIVPVSNFRITTCFRLCIENSS
jgi:hypothetical protein